MVFYGNGLTYCHNFGRDPCQNFAKMFDADKTRMVGEEAMTMR